MYLRRHPFIDLTPSPVESATEPLRCYEALPFRLVAAAHPGISSGSNKGTHRHECLIQG
jgi:hypothetical protein